MHHQKLNKLIHGILWIALIAQFSAIVILAWVPPVSRDALTHHLFIPRLYIEHGSIFEIPSIPFSYYPMNLDLLYLIPLYFGNDILPKYIHFSFALLTGLIIYKYLKQRFEKNIALLGCISFLSTPIIVKLSVTAYVDLGLIFFTTASLLWLINWTRKDFQLRYLVGAGLFCGLAIGTKYNGIVGFVLLALLVPLLYSRCCKKEHLSNSKAILFGILFTATSLAATSPWLIKNYIQTNNPIYPLHNTTIQQIFGDQATPNTPQSSLQEKRKKKEKTSPIRHLLLRKVRWNESWWQTALLPVRFFFEGQDDDPHFFDGKLNPLLLLLPLMLFVVPNENKNLAREQYFLASFAFFFFFYTFFQEVLRIRYISPIIPALVVLAMTALHNITAYINSLDSLVHRKLFSQLAIIIPALFIIGYNGNYNYELFTRISPLEYITGKLNRIEYIDKYRPEYPTLRYINKRVSPHEKVLCLYLGNRGYYMGFMPVFQDITSNALLFRDVKAPITAKAIRNNLHHHGISFIVLRNNLTLRGMTLIPPEKKAALEHFFRKYTKKLHDKNGYSCFYILPPQQ